MASVDSLARFGQFAARGVLDPAECASVRAAMAGATRVAATVWDPDHGEIVAPALKRRQDAWLPPSREVTLVEERLDALRPAIAQALGVVLTTREPLKFTRYGAGDFFGPHADVSPAAHQPAIIARRQASAVLFLDGPTHFGGGRLALHDLIADPLWRGHVHTVDPEEGALVAFSPTIVHEVTAVTWGFRHTVLTWWR